MFYRAVGNRCAICVRDLKLPLQEKKVLSVLSSLGFEIREIDIVNEARSLIGRSSYRLKARISEAPEFVDCSGLIKYVYGLKGIWLPRLSIQQRAFAQSIGKTALRPGDLIFRRGFRNFYETDPADDVGHVGILSDCDTVIHAYSRKQGIIETEYDRFVGAHARGVRRILGQGVLTTISPAAFDIETSDDFRWLILRTLYRA